VSEFGSPTPWVIDSSGANDYSVWNLAEADWWFWQTDDAAEQERLADLIVTFGRQCDELGVSTDQRWAACKCRALRTKIESGDGGAVLDAVGYCAAGGLVMPRWLADEYLRRHGNVGRGQAKEWSDDRAFGHAYPKGTNIATIRARVEDAPAAYRVAAELLAQDPRRPLDAAFYEAIGIRIGVGKTRAQELVTMRIRDKDAPSYPLTDLRAKLAAGLTLEESLRALANERWHRLNTGK
jgi:hypothetical protein